jgi:hypothetical protein
MPIDCVQKPVFDPPYLTNEDSQMTKQMRDAESNVDRGAPEGNVYEMNKTVAASLKRIQAIRQREAGEDALNAGANAIERAEVEQAAAKAAFGKSNTTSDSTTPGPARQIRKKPSARDFIRVGAKYYSPTNRQAAAFEDQGGKLVTSLNGAAVAASMVVVAQSKGWNDIKVSGTKEFRRSAWFEAASRGMGVKGYAPSDLDKAELESRNADRSGQPRRSDSPNQEPGPSRPTSSQEQSKGPQDGTEPVGSTSANELDQKRSAAFLAGPPQDAVAKYPELAGTYCAIAAVSSKARADKLTAQQRAIVMARARLNVVESLNRGDVPTAELRIVPRQIEHSTGSERELER